MSLPTSGELCTDEIMDSISDAEQSFSGDIDLSDEFNGSNGTVTPIAFYNSNYYMGNYTTNDRNIKKYDENLNDTGISYGYSGDNGAWCLCMCGNTLWVYQRNPELIVEFNPDTLVPTGNTITPESSASILFNGVESLASDGRYIFTKGFDRGNVIDGYQRIYYYDTQNPTAAPEYLTVVLGGDSGALGFEVQIADQLFGIEYYNNKLYAVTHMQSTLSDGLQKNYYKAIAIIDPLAEGNRILDEDDFFTYDTDPTTSDAKELYVRGTPQLMSYEGTEEYTSFAHTVRAQDYPFSEVYQNVSEEMGNNPTNRGTIAYHNDYYYVANALFENESIDQYDSNWNYTGLSTTGTGLYQKAMYSIAVVGGTLWLWRGNPNLILEYSLETLIPTGRTITPVSSTEAAYFYGRFMTGDSRYLYVSGQRTSGIPVNYQRISIYDTQELTYIRYSDIPVQHLVEAGEQADPVVSGLSIVDGNMYVRYETNTYLNTLGFTSTWATGIDISTSVASATGQRYLITKTQETYLGTCIFHDDTYFYDLFGGVWNLYRSLESIISVGESVLCTDRDNVLSFTGKAEGSVVCIPTDFYGRPETPVIPPSEPSQKLLIDEEGMLVWQDNDTGYMHQIFDVESTTKGNQEIPFPFQFDGVGIPFVTVCNTDTSDPNQAGRNIPTSVTNSGFIYNRFDNIDGNPIFTVYASGKFDGTAHDGTWTNGDARVNVSGAYSSSDNDQTISIPDAFQTATGDFPALAIGGTKASIDTIEYGEAFDAKSITGVNFAINRADGTESNFTLSCYSIGSTTGQQIEDYEILYPSIGVKFIVFEIVIDTDNPKEYGIPTGFDSKPVVIPCGTDSAPSTNAVMCYSVTENSFKYNRINYVDGSVRRKFIAIGKWS